MAFTQADLDELDKAIKSGALRVRTGDRDVTYRSLEEMMKIRGQMLEALGLVQNGGITLQPMAYDKGLEEVEGG